MWMGNDWYFFRELFILREFSMYVSVLYLPCMHMYVLVSLHEKLCIIHAPEYFISPAHAKFGSSGPKLDRHAGRYPTVCVSDRIQVPLIRSNDVHRNPPDIKVDGHRKYNYGGQFVFHHFTKCPNMVQSIWNMCLCLFLANFGQLSVGEARYLKFRICFS